MIFHRHKFKPLETDEEKLYCECGKVKDVHRCIWIELGTVEGEYVLLGGTCLKKILKCTICGDHKVFKIA